MDIEALAQAVTNTAEWQEARQGLVEETLAIEGFEDESADLEENKKYLGYIADRDIAAELAAYLKKQW